ncbi:Cupin-like domain-containing protein [Pseudoxanthomonas sp. GM95]|uniref:cupin-like domain-containing protein n=1 Tax=Pseudoxanthomonas sp. GM95 TaxID=1881043 RepID=UPI0008D46FA6|nr:cupin-like domain-containing protein [Pseudoxanthomonas sp. GM95]SEM17215.1 Cupin-like domain-containing protein [Pseudoxanthomonas sp. GM95]
MSLPTPEPIAERHGLDPRALPDEVLHSTRPLVLRGLVAEWPMAQAGAQSPPAAIDYLRRFDRGAEVVAHAGPPETGGRLFYNDAFNGFNFRPEKVKFSAVLDTLQRRLDDPAPPAIYMGSTTLDTYLPGFRDENPLNLDGQPQVLASIWVGNRTRIAAHQDLPDNLACVVAGRRRFTLFPPDQLPNLYIGPLDLTPAGQAISLVDFHAPDLERFPRFAEALAHAQVAELAPGDALMIPSMWWHHIEALEAFNVLVNYWWRATPAYMDTPMNALMLAMMTVRDLPPEQRRIWQDVFHHYVFEPGEATDAHIPESARGVLAPMDEPRARALRGRLLQRLNR